MMTIVKGVTPASLVEAENKGWSWDEFVSNDHEGYLTSQYRTTGCLCIYRVAT